MHNDTRFIHTRTGEVIEVIGTDAELSKVVTVTATGRHIRPRTIKTTSLKTTLTTRRGTEWKAAYVAVSALPTGHPLAPAAEPQPQISTARVDLRAMDDMELSAYSRQKKAEAALAADLYEDTKKELKRRNPDAQLYIYGDTALSITTNRRFDATLAKKTLTPVEYQAICLPKPDATLAKEVLSEDRYAEICKDHGNKIEVRFATQEDRDRLAEQEDIATRSDAVSFIPDDAVAPF